jgi:gliding motility-associated-like protein
LNGNGVNLTPVLNFTEPVTFLWSPSININNVTIASPTVSPIDDIIYTLTITSSNGCKSADQVLVKVLKQILIPNAFSPNGDGIHDLWEIKNLATYPGSVITIFNRYGQPIHNIVNYSAAWDGKVNRKEAPAGTYYYIIDPKNGKNRLSGYVDIIR